MGVEVLKTISKDDLLQWEMLNDFLDERANDITDCYVEIPNNQDTKQYINVVTVTKILITDEDDYIDLKFYFVNDDSPLNKIMQEKDGALKIISEIKEKIAKLKSEYVDHF